MFKDDLLKRWRSILSQENNEVTQSRLQTEVIQFLEQYIPAAESEKRINTLPVDALFMISQVLAFIAQIDGPPHFLHDEIGNPIPTLKTEFRNQILEMSSNYPTICFSYDELRQYSTQRFMYFSKKLKDEAGIDLNPAEVWKKVTARKEPAFSSFIFSSTANQPPAAMQQPVKVEENNNQLRM